PYFVLFPAFPTAAPSTSPSINSRRKLVMGGGNAQKSATARARNEAKKAKAGKGSQLAVNQAAQNVICQVGNNTKLISSGLAVFFRT
ncbi:unnamed protein product, partial [Scytosiphon promiscuus]